MHLGHTYGLLGTVIFYWNHFCAPLKVYIYISSSAPSLCQPPSFVIGREIENHLVPATSFQKLVKIFTRPLKSNA